MDKTAKERMRRYRNKQRNGDVTVSPESVTRAVEGVTPDVTAEHPVMKYLIDPDKRKKMEAIVQSLKEHHQLKNVYLGYPNLGGIPLDIVGEMLEVTQ